MLRNKQQKKQKLNIQSTRRYAPVIKLFSLSAVFLLQAACGGGESDSEASAIGIQDVSIAYVKRPTPRDQNGDIITHDMREPAAFTEGGDLYLQERASASAAVKNITGGMTNGLGDVKDVSVSYDGTKLLFSLRLEDPNPNDNIIPTWNLYEYDIINGSLTALIAAGQQEDGDDISAHYLPDDRIIFSSTRKPESKGLRGNESRDASFEAVDENRRNSSFAIHVRDTNGDIKQVSFNPSHDLYPIVLRDSGKVLFTRWNNMGGRNDFSLYTMNPDGSDVQLYYGAHSHRTGQDPDSDIHFSMPREMGDGRIMAKISPIVTNFGEGDFIFINGKDFADNTQPVWSQQGFISGTAQTVFKQTVTNSNGLSLLGRYNAAFPMLDGSNRFLMSWSQCQILEVPTDPNSRIIPCTLASPAQLNDPNVQEAPPSYGIVLVDAGSNTQVPLVLPQADTLFNEVVMAYATKKPPVIFDKVEGISAEINKAFFDDDVGVLHIRSVYDFDNNFSAYGATLPTVDNDGNPITIDSPSMMANPKNTTADQRPARFIRITKNVSFSDPLPGTNNRLSNTAFGPNLQLGMREIVGYAPIEPDGSVKIKIPAHVPLTLDILDKDGRRISARHQSWFQVKPGETLECIGCHVHDTNNQDSNKPHGRPDYASTFNQGAPTTGIGFPFSLDALWAEIGETMAETRARHSCLQSPPNTCADMKPSTDLMYSDAWTDEVAANRSADTSFTIDYTDAPVSPLTAPAPVTSTSNACTYDYLTNSTLSFTYCRIVINYKDHIHPMWSKDRGADTCTNCHTTSGNTQVAPGQLELTDGISPDEPDHLNAYRELLFDDEKQELVGTTLTTVTVQDTDNNGNPLFLLDGNGVQVLDINGNPIPIMVPVIVSPSISTGGARSSYFMEKMTNTELNANRTLPTLLPVGTGTDHSNMLTASELKLLSEWIDIGAQYFNNPFDDPTVPTN